MTLRASAMKRFVHSILAILVSNMQGLPILIADARLVCLLFHSVFGNQISEVVSSPMTNMSIQHGYTAYLPCSVRNLEDRNVSWVRLRDRQILSVGGIRYVDDDRFQVIYMNESEDWLLQIKYISMTDQGVYECQLSGIPHISRYVNLYVIGVAAEIDEGESVYLLEGHVIRLTCRIKGPQPVFIFWYRNNQMMNYLDFDGFITQEKSGNGTLSRLYIRAAQMSDSGKYACVPSNVEPAYIEVYVLNGSDRNK